MFQSEESWDIKQSKTHYKAKYLRLFAKQKYIIRLIIAKTLRSINCCIFSETNDS